MLPNVYVITCAPRFCGHVAVGVLPIAARQVHGVVERSRFAAGGACCAGGCDLLLAIPHGFFLLRLSGPRQSNFNRRILQ